MDVTNAPSIARAAANIHDGAIDVLINSAGINGKPGQTIGNVDYISWRRCWMSIRWGRFGLPKLWSTTLLGANGSLS
jgi:NAD(P)-dependent dehydrogenase (short-subunit alcohol dehydrogenase family)